MSKIETLTEKVQKAGEKVEKCKGTIARHEKQLVKKLAKVSDLGATLENLSEKREEYRGGDRSWDLYEVESKLNDIDGAKKKLRDAEIILENWQEKLNKEIDKVNFINNNAPQVIIDFLEDWKNKAYDWHVKKYEAYQNFKAELDKEVAQAKSEIGNPTYREMERALKEKGLDYKSVQSKKANFAGGTILHMDGIRNEKDRLDWLEKTLQNEKIAKLIDLITRINDIVGTITDASHLRVSQVGNLNGFIDGKKGRAKVETIGAGGYNIQCFHYRTLVHKIA